MTTYTVADVSYDAATHRSTLPDGTDVPHVTHVLGAVRVSTDFEEMKDVSPRAARNIAFAGARGTAVHADCHAYDDDDLDFAAVHPGVLPYVEAWVRLRRDKGLTPLIRERRLFHPTHRYCGIMDGLFVARGVGRIKRVLLDIKTGDPEDAAGHLQTAAYEGAYRAMHPAETVDERWCVWLRPDLAVPYRIVNYSARADAHADFGRWLACLTTYNEQPARRRRRNA